MWKTANTISNRIDETIIMKLTDVSTISRLDEKKTLVWSILLILDSGNDRTNQKNKLFIYRQRLDHETSATLIKLIASKCQSWIFLFARLFIDECALTTIFIRFLYQNLHRRFVLRRVHLFSAFALVYFASKNWLFHNVLYIEAIRYTYGWLLRVNVTLA